MLLPQLRSLDASLRKKTTHPPLYTSSMCPSIEPCATPAQVLLPQLLSLDASLRGAQGEAHAARVSGHGKVFTRLRAISLLQSQIAELRNKRDCQAWRAARQNQTQHQPLLTQLRAVRSRRARSQSSGTNEALFRASAISGRAAPNRFSPNRCSAPKQPADTCPQNTAQQKTLPR